MSKLQGNLSDKSLDFAIITNPQNVCYLTGYSAYPFDAGLNCVVIPKQGELTFIAHDGEDRLATNLGWKIVSYESFSIDRRIHAVESLADTLLHVLGHHLRIGIEGDYLPSNTRQVLVEALKPSELSDLSSTLTAMRVRKDRDEVDRIRKSVRLAEIGVETMLQRAEVGSSEIEVYSSVRAAMEASAGKPIDMYTDMISGEKCLEIGYPLAVASSKRMLEGDDVVCDVLVRMDGYLGDLTRTKHLGARTSKQSDIYLAVKEAEKAAIEQVRPGVSASEVDSVARHVIEEYGFHLPHYTGHGIGLHFREEPILVPWNSLKLEPGMVLTIEPGIYDRKEGSVRLEDNVLVTETSHDVLSTLPYEL